MKVQAPNGRWYTRDHPHEIISPRVMRFEVIRYWLKELSENPAYGWTDGGRAGLSRALGMQASGTIAYKLAFGWIWPKEQVRLTARINDILQGYIVPKRFGARVDGVWTDPPTPVVVPKVREIKFQVHNGAPKFLAQDQAPRMKLPDFKEAFRNVSFWDP